MSTHNIGEKTIAQSVMDRNTWMAQNIHSESVIKTYKWSVIHDVYRTYGHILGELLKKQKNKKTKKQK